MNYKFTLGKDTLITDPCYEKGTWCAQRIETMPGKWIGRACMHQGRVDKLYACHEDHFVNNPILVRAAVGEVGVDSGQMGIFNDEYYPDKPHETNFYDTVCEMTLSKDQAGGLEYGIVSSTGWGDGGYDVFANYIDGKAVAIMIDFQISEGEDEDEDQDDRTCGPEDEDDEDSFDDFDDEEKPTEAPKWRSDQLKVTSPWKPIGADYLKMISDMHPKVGTRALCAGGYPMEELRKMGFFATLGDIGYPFIDLQWSENGVMISGCGVQGDGTNASADGSCMSKKILELTIARIYAAYKKEQVKEFALFPDMV